MGELPYFGLAVVKPRVHTAGMTAAVFVLTWVICAGVAALLAARKHRSVGGFAVAGLLLGPVGVLWAAVAFSREELEPGRAARRSWWQRTTTRYWLG